MVVKSWKEINKEAVFRKWKLLSVLDVRKHLMGLHGLGGWLACDLCLLIRTICLPAPRSLRSRLYPLRARGIWLYSLSVLWTRWRQVTGATWNPTLPFPHPRKAPGSLARPRFLPDLCWLPATFISSSVKSSYLGRVCLVLPGGRGGEDKFWVIWYCPAVALGSNEYTPSEPEDAGTAKNLVVTKPGLWKAAKHFLLLLGSPHLPLFVQRMKVI